MIKAIQKRIKNNKGFTLVELIVVLAILGIIATIAVPRFVGLQDDAKMKADSVTAENIASAAKLAYANDDITIDDDGVVDISTLSPKYIEKDPKAQVKNKNGFKLVVKDDGTVEVTYSDDSEVISEEPDTAE